MWQNFKVMVWYLHFTATRTLQGCCTGNPSHGWFLWLLSPGAALFFKNQNLWGTFLSPGVRTTRPMSWPSHATGNINMSHHQLMLWVKCAEMYGVSHILVRRSHQAVTPHCTVDNHQRTGVTYYDTTLASEQTNRGFYYYNKAKTADRTRVCNSTAHP